MLKGVLSRSGGKSLSKVHAECLCVCGCSEVPQPVPMFYAWPNIFDFRLADLSVPAPTPPSNLYEIICKIAQTRHTRTLADGVLWARPRNCVCTRAAAAGRASLCVRCIRWAPPTFQPPPPPMTSIPNLFSPNDTNDGRAGSTHPQENEHTHNN